MYRPRAGGSSGAAAASDGAALSVWMVPRGVDLALLTQAALAEVEPPDLRVHVLAGDGDTIVVQVAEGVAPYDPDELMYVERHGAYEVLHRDVSCGETAPRVRLTLAAWPRR